ncbi:MAG TPA: hypothetical protein VFY20_06135 [Gemmatimonadales bacterium]|nr:hypothetical protein [Gemmatimonadales bacterium]
MRHRPAGVQPARAHHPAVQLCRRVGAGLVEYVLLIALIAVGLVMIMTQFRNATGGKFNQANDALVSSSSNSFGGSGNGNGNGGGNGNGNGNNGNRGEGNQGNGNGNQ